MTKRLKDPKTGRFIKREEVVERAEQPKEELGERENFSILRKFANMLIFDPGGVKDALDVAYSKRPEAPERHSLVNSIMEHAERIIKKMNEEEGG